tara:strand:+ start:19 stop:447 length:429 start_codon:yes stop_codon:yes gene_type:complete
MDEAMNEGVQLLLARMESHPDEFVKYGRWHEALTSVKEFDILTEGEINLLNTKLREARRKAFTASVMDCLFTDEGKGPPIPATLAANQPSTSSFSQGISALPYQYSQYNASPGAQDIQQKLSAQHNTAGLLGNLFNKFKSTP